MSIPVYIAIYPISDGNYHHWSMFIKQSDTKRHVYEVVGEHPVFQYNHIESRADPSSNSIDAESNPPGTSTIISTTSKSHDGRHFKNILVGYVTEQDVMRINEILPQVPIDNENSGWCCQDWVLEALEELCTEYILDEDDELFCFGVRKAKRSYFGPIM